MARNSDLSIIENESFMVFEDHGLSARTVGKKKNSMRNTVFNSITKVL